MANTITTSVVVQFTQGSSAGVLVAEVDDRASEEGGLNGGKTSFVPGDPVYLLLYKSSNVILDAYQASLGSLAQESEITISKTEDITFAGETETTTRYPITGGSLSSVQWIGASLGAISIVGENTLRVPTPGSGYPVGFARVTYNTKARKYKLTHSDPGFSEYSIIAFFAGHTP